MDREQNIATLFVHFYTTRINFNSWINYVFNIGD